MSGFTHEALFQKARVFVARGISARNSGESEEWQLWSALALEVLAKAALAFVHPVLVADPKCEDSLLAACGRPIGQTRKSLGAVQVFQRVRRVYPQVTARHVEFCQTMAARRNGHLHSGELPFAGIRDESWASTYWTVTQALLGVQGKVLTDVVADDEAKRVDALIAARITALEHAVLARIEQCRQQFDQQYPVGSAERAQLEQREGQMSSFGIFRDLVPDMTQAERCPACGQWGAAGYERVHSEPVTVDLPEEEEWRSYMRVHYVALAFRCQTCGLRLRDPEEMEVARMETETESEEEWEPEDDGEYMDE